MLHFYVFCSVECLLYPQTRGVQKVGITVGPMGMGINSSGMGGSGNFFREIPTPSDLYQIYSNLLIEFTITVVLTGDYFISFWYHLYAFVQILTCCLSLVMLV